MKNYSTEDIQISVVIPCFNAESTILLQLEALENQIGPPKFEVIISNNNCTDKTVEKVMQYARTSNLNIQIADASAVQGINFARNAGLAKASAPYIMICDADDVVGEKWLAHGLKNFSYHRIWSGSAIPISDTEFPTDLKSARALFDRPDKPWKRPILEQSGVFQVLMGGNFGAERKYLLHLGGFDVAAPSPGDDNELAMRVLKDGEQIPVSKDVLIGYRNRTSFEYIARSYYLGGKSHAWLATQYGVLRDSPYGNPAKNLLKTYLLLPLKYLINRKDVQWRDIVLRQQSTKGFALGYLLYKVLRKQRIRRLGEGWIKEDLTSVA